MKYIEHSFDLTKDVYLIDNEICKYCNLSLNDIIKLVKVTIPDKAQYLSVREMVSIIYCITEDEYMIKSIIE